MALVQYGGGIVGMRGSIAGTVHSKNRYGNYVRARTTPVNPNTNRQSAMRNIIQQLSQAWSTILTATEHAAWEVFAAAIVRTNKLGATIKLTGFNHFIRANAFLLQNGGTMVTAGPTTLNLPGADPTFSASASSASQNIAVTFDNTLDWANEAGGLLGVYMSMPKSSGTSFIAGPYRRAGVIEGAGSPPSSPASIAAPFPIAVSQQVKVKGRIVRADARLSDPFYDQSGVGA